MFESIYWEQYKKAMALSGAVLPPTMTPTVAVAREVSPIATNAEASIHMEAAVPQDQFTPLQNLQPTPDEVNNVERMDVDEPKREEAGLEETASHCNKDEIDAAELPASSKTELLQNENNGESRCSNSSNDDMWRPW